MNAPKKRVGRKLLGVTLGLASMSMAGTACTCGNLASPYDYDAADSDAGARDTGSDDTGATGSEDSGVEDGGGDGGLGS